MQTFEQLPRREYRAIANELNEMAASDQAMRNSEDFDETVDRQNTARLQEIVGEIGWPSLEFHQRKGHDLSRPKRSYLLWRER